MVEPRSAKPLADNPLLLIVGAAPCVWDDVEAFWRLEPPGHDVCCLNDAGRFWPCTFKHWASYHPVRLVGMAKRCSPDTQDRPLLHGHIETDGLDYVWQTHRSEWGGSTAMFALRCAVRNWGYRRVVLAGVPLENGENIFCPESVTQYESLYLKFWQDRANDYGVKTRSMSGNTKDLFGAPTKEWLYGDVC